MFKNLASIYKAPNDVDAQDFRIPATDGALINVRLYRKRGTAPTGVVLYIHGGGMIMCNLETHDGVCRDYASMTGLNVVAVDYRLAPQHPFPTPVEDCYAVLRWLADQAGELGLDPERIVVAGESAGGGLAAAVTLMAKDRGFPQVAGQLLIYPMLDDRTVTPDPKLEAVAVWTYDDNVTAWAAYLGADPINSPYATPVRADDLGGLPPTYLEVGEFDIFRDEDLEYLRRLLNAGVPVEFHLHPSVPHAFELFAPDAEVSRRALADRYRFLLQVTSKS